MRYPALAYAAVAGSANIVGAAAVTWRRAWSRRALEVMVAMAAGFMIAVALLEMLPEAIGRGAGAGALSALVGFLLVHLTQHTLSRHFHFGEETHVVSSAVGTSALAGLLVHTLVDGVAIASAFQVGQALGVLVFLAVLLHKAPEGVAIASLFLAAGRSGRAALFAASLLGTTTVVGAAAVALSPVRASSALGLSAGVTLYVAASNLIPEFQGKRDWRIQAAFFGGCGLFLLARSAMAGA